MCVRKRRLTSTMQASTSSGGSHDASISGSLRGVGAEVHDSHAADERVHGRVCTVAITQEALLRFERRGCGSSSSAEAIGLQRDYPCAHANTTAVKVTWATRAHSMKQRRVRPPAPTTQNLTEGKPQ